MNEHELRTRNAFEEAAKIADKWRDENKAAAERERQTGSKSMADRLDGAAFECNAIAQAIRERKGTERPSWSKWREPSLVDRPY